jgi:hypothetical protein
MKMKVEMTDMEKYWRKENDGSETLREEDYVYENAYEGNCNAIMEQRVYAGIAARIREEHIEDERYEEDRDTAKNCLNGILLKISDQLERIADALEKGQNDEH